MADTKITDLTASTYTAANLLPTVTPANAPLKIPQSEFAPSTHTEHTELTLTGVPNVPIKKAYTSDLEIGQTTVCRILWLRSSNGLYFYAADRAQFTTPNMYVGGNITTTPASSGKTVTSDAFVQHSQGRKKENIRDIPNAPSLLSAIKAKIYGS